MVSLKSSVSPIVCIICKVKSIPFLSQLSSLDNIVRTSNQATCFNLNYVIFRLINLKKKHNEEENIKLHCTECITDFRGAGFVNLCIF